MSRRLDSASLRHAEIELSVANVFPMFSDRTTVTYARALDRSNARPGHSKKPSELLNDRGEPSTWGNKETGPQYLVAVCGCGWKSMPVPMTINVGHPRMAIIAAAMWMIHNQSVPVPVPEPVTVDVEDDVEIVPPREIQS